MSLAMNICAHLRAPLGDCRVGTFADGEVSVSLRESVRGCDVFLIQSTCAPVNDHLMELLVMMDACRRASAQRVTAVMPYFGYARQDRKAHSRDPISAKLVADLLTAAGCDRVLTMDLHAPQLQGFFNIPVNHLLGLPLFAEYFAEKFGEERDDLVAVSPDIGSVARVRAFAQRMGVPLAIVDKRRMRPNESEVESIIGDVAGKRVILFDDMVDTAGSMVGAAEALITRGGAKEIYACASHPVMSGPAYDRVKHSVLSELAVSDTIPLRADADKIRLLSVAPLFAEAIRRVHEGESISPLYT